MLDSPYKRPELPPLHQPCPNCGNAVPADELHAVSIGCIVRQVKRLEKLQQEQLRRGEEPATDLLMSSLDAVFSDNTVSWVTMPPVLRRLRCPLHELYTRKALLAQETHLCSACADTFVDEEEMTRCGAEAAATAASRHAASGTRDRRAKPQPLPFYATRQPDRCVDMVFSSQQATQRKNDQRIRAKQQLRLQFLSKNKQSVDWDSIPLRSNVTRALKEAPQLPGALDLATNGADFVASLRPPRPPADSRHVALISNAPSTATAPSGTGRQLVSSQLMPLDDPFTALPDDRAQDADGAGLAADIDGLLPPPSRVSRFDVSFAEHCMFELFDNLSRLCEFGRPRRSDSLDVEDVPRSHPLFTVYRSNALRFPEPPVTNVDLHQVAAIDNDPLQGEHSAGTSTRGVFDAAAAESIPELAHYDEAERRLLLEIIADATLLPEGVDGGHIDGITQVLESGSDSDDVSVEEDEDVEGDW